MAIKTKKFVRKPFDIEAIQVTAENMEEVARWCRGQLRKSGGPGGRNTQRYIKVNVKRSLSDRQTTAYVGDWVVNALDQSVKGFKVYTPKAFSLTFEEVVDDMVETLGRMNERAATEERMEDEGLFPEELTYARTPQ